MSEPTLTAGALLVVAIGHSAFVDTAVFKMPDLSLIAQPFLHDPSLGIGFTVVPIGFVAPQPGDPLGHVTFECRQAAFVQNPTDVLPLPH